MRSALLLLLSLAVPAAWAQTADVRLEPHAGKTHFYLGEPIQLDLVFQNTGTAPLTINATDYGDLSEKVSITPAIGWMAWRGQSGHDFSTVTDLTSTPMRIPVRLNDGYVFRAAGHYDVSVTTQRVSSGKPMTGSLLPAVTTNTVSIDLEEMPAAMEADRLRTILNDMVNAPAGRSGGAARQSAAARLAALQGDEAVAEKVRRIVAGDTEFRSVTSVALANTRHPQLQLDLLQAAWRDPHNVPQWDIPGAMTQTRQLIAGVAQPGWHMAVMPRELSPAEKAIADAHTQDMVELLQSMPLRTGKSRTMAAYYLLEFGGLPDADKAQAHEYAVQEFPHMDYVAQGMLLQTARPPLRDARLLPALKDALQRRPGEREAVKAAVELSSGEEQRSIVIDAVCHAPYPVQLDTLAAFTADRLPEVDACLAAQLRAPATAPARPDNRWAGRAVLAARFATPAILADVRSGYQDPEWQAASMLAVLMRMAPKDAATLLAQRPGVSMFESGKVYELLHQPYPAEVLSYLRTVLKSDEGKRGRFAGYELSRHGEAADEALLEQRLAQLRKVSAAMASEVQSNTDWLSPAGQVRADERDLMDSLAHATAWKLSPDQVRALAAGCMSDECRRYGKPPAPVAVP